MNQLMMKNLSQTPTAKINNNSKSIDHKMNHKIKLKETIN